MAGEVLKLVYWAGLAMVALIGFSFFGVSIGMVINDFPRGLLIAFPGIIGGVLVTVALALIWRAFCEFVTAIFRISEDLRALRQAQDADRRNQGR